MRELRDRADDVIETGGARRLDDENIVGAQLIEPDAFGRRGEETSQAFDRCGNIRRGAMVDGMPAGCPGALLYRADGTSAREAEMAWHVAALVRARKRKSSTVGTVLVVTGGYHTVALPALVAGKYTLVLDMVDEQQGWFYQHGAEPLERQFVVEKSP